MPDKEKLRRLLTDFGVEFEEHPISNSITCREGREKIDGYSMFFTDFEFDDDNKFVKMGAWE